MYDVDCEGKGTRNYTEYELKCIADVEPSGHGNPMRGEQCSVWLTVLTVQRCYVHLPLHGATHRLPFPIGCALHVNHPIAPWSSNGHQLFISYHRLIIK